jgi:hypothetical protein
MKNVLRNLLKWELEKELNFKSTKILHTNNLEKLEEYQQISLYNID